MKKIIVFVFLTCLLTVPAFAVDIADYQYVDEDGKTVFNEDGYNYAVAVEMVEQSGVSLTVSDYWYVDDLGELRFDMASFEADYAAAVQAMESSTSETETGEDPTTLDDPAPGEGDSSDDPVYYDTDDSDYPVGSYVDEDGNVFSPEGVLLSSGTVSVSEDGTDDTDSDSVSDTEDPTEDDGESFVPAVYTLSDLRSGDTDSGTDALGLKALIISIFGEYTPVMTTMAVTETVDNVTTTTLVDAVASGAAGVDYEWLAGVALFGILLFCLMKLLGGILK